MTDDYLDEVEARANAATPGPWDCDDGNVGCVPLAEARFKAAMERLEGNGQDRSDPDPREFVCSVPQDNPDVDALEQFIAHAREDVPALVAEVRKLKALLAKPFVQWGSCDGCNDDRGMTGRQPNGGFGYCPACGEQCEEWVDAVTKPLPGKHRPDCPIGEALK